MVSPLPIHVKYWVKASNVPTLRASTSTPISGTVMALISLITSSSSSITSPSIVW